MRACEHVGRKWKASSSSSSNSNHNDTPLSLSKPVVASCKPQKEAPYEDGTGLAFARNDSTVSS